MNIRIGDEVKILDKKMKDYYGKRGKVVDAEWALKVIPKTMVSMHNKPSEIIAFEVEVPFTASQVMLPNAWFGEENLVAYK